MNTTPQPTTPTINLLIIDDDDADVLAVRRALERDAPGVYTFSRASTLREGLELAASSAWSVALVDERLPDGRGAALVRILRSRDRITPIVMMSGAADLEPLQRLWAIGAIQGWAPKDAFRPPGELAGLLERAFNATRDGEPDLATYTRDVLRELRQRHGHDEPPTPPPQSGATLRRLELKLKRMMPHGSQPRRELLSSA